MILVCINVPRYKGRLRYWKPRFAPRVFIRLAFRGVSLAAPRSPTWTSRTCGDEAGARRSAGAILKKRPASACCSSDRRHDPWLVG